MNALIVGTKKTDSILEHLPDSFLLIDDGPIIDAYLDEHPLPKDWKEISESPSITLFDVEKDSFNPLTNINYRRAKEFISVLDAIFPEGENTLTKKTSNFQLLTALLSNPKRLDKLIRPNKENADAYQKIQTLLLSPVLERVLCRATSFPLKGIILARLNRAELGDFDCFVIANLLISQYKGQVVIPDFGFYACPFHTSLIRQDRLIAGVNFIDEAPKLRNNLLLIEEKIGKHCTVEDAETLADFAGIRKSSVDYRDFIQTSMGV